jgi:hypothetical protein
LHEVLSGNVLTEAQTFLVFLRHPRHTAAMRKWFYILLVVVLIAGLGGVAWQVSRPREPVYQGKPLSFWVGSCESAMNGSVAYRQAEEAIRQIGTNAIPTLLLWLRANDSPLTSEVFELATRQHFIKVRHTSAYRRNGQAQDVFRRLGTSAKAAVPELSKIYDQNISASSQCPTAGALAWIGSAAKSPVPSLLRGINNPDEGVSLQTIHALGYIDAGLEQVVPALIQCLKDRSPNVKKKRAVHARGIRARRQSCRPSHSSVLE